MEGGEKEGEREERYREGRKSEGREVRSKCSRLQLGTVLHCSVRDMIRLFLLSSSSGSDGLNVSYLRTHFVITVEGQRGTETERGRESESKAIILDRPFE